MDFLYLLKEEWSYHFINIMILIVFSIYGTYLTIKKNIKLSIFSYIDENNKDISDKKKKEIEEGQNRIWLKEFTKSFLVLFIIYSIYVLFKMGYLLPQ